MDLPFDNTRRRRIHLMRHAEAAYFIDDNTRAPDPHLVPLTPKGREQAAAMGELMSCLTFDRAICSGLPRTVETATAVLRDRKLKLDIIPELEEIRGAALADRQTIAPADYAYAFFKAHEPEARFVGGERYTDFLGRVLPAFERIVEDKSWTSLLLVAHGGVNRAIMSWVIRLGLDSLAVFEQDSCCLNVIDLDCDRETGQIVRRTLRAVNVTSYDPCKHDIRYLTMEGFAKRAADALGKTSSQ
jgi:broad specificity phosphatase PhoE